MDTYCLKRNARSLFLDYRGLLISRKPNNILHTPTNLNGSSSFCTDTAFVQGVLENQGNQPLSKSAINKIPPHSLLGKGCKRIAANRARKSNHHNSNRGHLAAQGAGPAREPSPSWRKAEAKAQSGPGAERRRPSRLPGSLPSSTGCQARRRRRRSAPQCRGPRGLGVRGRSPARGRYAVPGGSGADRPEHRVAAAAVPSRESERAAWMAGRPRTRAGAGRTPVTLAGPGAAATCACAERPAGRWPRAPGRLRLSRLPGPTSTAAGMEGCPRSAVFLVPYLKIRPLPFWVA